MKRVAVTGAAGFIGSHLVQKLKRAGHYVRGVDINRPPPGMGGSDEFLKLDLRVPGNCHLAMNGVEDVYALAAEMGGIGYISSHLADLARGNVLINAHCLHAAVEEKVKRYLYVSSACVYPAGHQLVSDVSPLKESDAIPAEPEPGYGWEKLFSEQLAQYFAHDHGLDIRIVRFHNIYGENGAYEGGREKAPAAICRKVAMAEPGGQIEIWGDGEQTRSFCHVSDCVEGLLRIMDSGYQQPINLGTDELVTINQLVDLTCDVAGKSLTKKHIPGPQGVRGRNSDNSLLRKVLGGWEPKMSLHEGLRRTYPWVFDQLGKARTR